VDEQTSTYTVVRQAFGDRKVGGRTLDAGADKPLAFADLGHEENPALGRRGIRLGVVRRDLLDDQLQALANAYQATKADLWVMAPMIATRQEAAWFAEIVRAKGLPRVGVMIEVPAAALRSFDVLSEVDFASLGTNDLGQYTMAADRMEGALSELLNRCVVRVGESGTPHIATAELTPRARAEIEAAMADVAPHVEDTMDTTCVECGRTVIIPFDLQRIFFGDLRADRDLLYREVHYLAFHYHWAERDIMAMTRDKRRAYIDLLAGEIDRLNDGV